MALSAGDAARPGALLSVEAFVYKRRILTSGDVLQLLRVDEHLDVIHRGTPKLL